MRTIRRLVWTFYNDRWRNQSWWRRAWYHFWEFVDRRVWHAIIRPHVFPRTCIEEERRWWKDRALPHDINAFIWESSEGYDDGTTYWVGELQERNGPWQLCCFQGDDEEDIKSEITAMLDHWEEKAGTRYPDRTYTIWWKHREPTDTDRCYTR